MNVGAVVLAAGGSTRLGSPKQLLEYGGRSLLRRAVEAALEAGCRPVVVVLGSGADLLKDQLAGLDVQGVVNPAWGNGMGTSVRLGVETLDALAPEADAVLLTLCDQPLVGPEALAQLLDAYRRSGSLGSIAAAEYNGIIGVPVILGRAHFGELLALPDDAGAKPVLRRHRESVIEVPMPEAATDIDTQEQYARLSGTSMTGP